VLGELIAVFISSNCDSIAHDVVAECEGCQPAGDVTNSDLEDLGIVLLMCMDEGEHRIRTADEIRKERAANRVFGLDNGERWSSSKRLLDFLDELFGIERKASAKFERPVGHISKPHLAYADCRKHEFAAANPRNSGVLLPFTEVAALECFTLWRAAAQF
jgi:hypothetical protein